MIKVVLLGSGNVASHLAVALSSATNIDLLQRYGRNNKNNSFFDPKIPFTSNLNEIEKADLYIIAINDDSIEAFSTHVAHLEGLVVHTSGSVPMAAIDRRLRKGVLYPVQTFSKGEALDFKSVPLALETENENDYKLLHELAVSISDKVIQVNTDQREKLHLSAVFANNFSNYMFLTAKDICDQNGLPFETLKPIILETARKIMNTDPLVAQTGPARRNDNLVIEKQLSSLKDEKKEIYSVLTKAIKNRYQN
jgi:predicted short-subunit dehydrogenase-like oxidoreductase (DUF2520 family)